MNGSSYTMKPVYIWECEQAQIKQHLFQATFVVKVRQFPL